MCQPGGDSIAIILVNYNGASDTIQCLESLRALKLLSAGAAIYVVENDSPDNSRERLREWLQQQRRLPTDWSDPDSGEIEADHGRIRVILLQSSANHGFAAGCNIGLARAYRDATNSHFWLLNNDTAVDPEAAMELLACSRKHGDRAICGSTLLYYDEPHVLQAAGGARYLRFIGRSLHVFKRKQISEIAGLPSPRFDYIVGASMFFSSSVLETVGFLPERYFLYAEETDWCTRARRCGISLDWARASLVLHKEGRSTGADARFQNLSDDTFYYVARNNLLFLWQYAKPFLFTAIAYCWFEALVSTVKGNPGRLRVAWRACRDFWRLRKYVETTKRPTLKETPATSPAGKSVG